MVHLYILFVIHFFGIRYRFDGIVVVKLVQNRKVDFSSNLTVISWTHIHKLLHYIRFLSVSLTLSFLVAGVFLLKSDQGVIYLLIYYQHTNKFVAIQQKYFPFMFAHPILDTYDHKTVVFSGFCNLSCNHK